MPNEIPAIAVIGSLNIDFVTRTRRLPDAGETFAALAFDTGFGGKGANQAVACARLAAGKDVQTLMVGQVGDDSFGRDYVATLEKEGIQVSGVRTLAGRQTGVTNIIVEEASGENRILFVANANDAYASEYDQGWDLLPSSCEVCVYQLEIPLRVVLHSMHQAREAGRHVVVNPAPAQIIPDAAYLDMDTLIMNETEASVCAGQAGEGADAGEDAQLALAKKYLGRGVREAVIITLGEKGLVYATASGEEGRVPAHEVEVVDTTAAGDTFVGAYAVERARHANAAFDYRKALEFATLAASKTVQRPGAMASIPRHDEL